MMISPGGLIRVGHRRAYSKGRQTAITGTPSVRVLTVRRWNSASLASRRRMIHEVPSELRWRM
jgi:hypothetical protein